MPAKLNVHSVRPYVKGSAPSTVLDLEKCKLLLPLDLSEYHDISEEDYFLFGGRQYRVPPVDLAARFDDGMPFEILYACDACGAGLQHMSFEHAMHEGTFWWALSDEVLVREEESRE
jgi:hypothetical protein